MKRYGENLKGVSRRSLLTSIGLGGLTWAISPPSAIADIAEKPGADEFSAPQKNWDALHYGKWSRDDAGLPCFDADLEHHPAPYLSFSHLISTGTLGAIADQWGNVKLITTEDGPTSLTPSSGKTRSGVYGMLETDGQLYSLIYSELKGDKWIRYGTGYAEYHGHLTDGHLRLTVKQELYALPNKDRSLQGQFTFQNTGAEIITGKFWLQSDIFIHPGLSYQNWVKSLKPDCGSGFAMFRAANAVLGDVFLLTDPQWTGSSRAHCLMLSKTVTLAPGESLTVPLMVGYSNRTDVSKRQSELAHNSPGASRQMWSKRLSTFGVNGLDDWMEAECRWTLGQLFAFENYDRILDQHYLHLGGYDFFPDLDNPRPHQAFTVREAAENALIVAHFEPALAKSTLRWLAKMQLASGDIPKNYNYTREGLDITGYEKDSDTEIWFLLALCEYVNVSADDACLDDVLAWFPEGETTLWDHAKRAFQWITKGIGVGQHGLILILDGDWNDYLSTVGARGKGESVMNSGMAAKAFDSLASIARKKGDSSFADQAETWRDALRTAVAKAFDKEWFIGCYTDDRRPIAGHNDRLYLNSQSWAVLGGCGTREQRRSALTSAVEQCGSSIGLMLMSKAYSSPAPPEISWCPIPCGEGENAGVWPQTIYWIVWAMAEEGMLGLALTEWKKGTLRNHAKAFPEVPYGIYNGPDCWSSRLAGRFEGWTQYDLFNRATPCPMSPMIAWQAFTMRKIDECRRRKTAGI
jgi:hypothetical protein